MIGVSMRLSVVRGVSAYYPKGFSHRIRRGTARHVAISRRMRCNMHCIALRHRDAPDQV